MKIILASLLSLVVLLLAGSAAIAGPLDEMSFDRRAKLRETERYQLDIAEKYYIEKNWKTAVGEYEKFLTLYETSEGAPYAQLKWSICQVHLKKLNTAIKDGFQSVLQCSQAKYGPFTDGHRRDLAAGIREDRNDQ